MFNYNNHNILEAIGFLDKEIYNSILPISSVGICTWLLLQPKSGTISDIAASIFGLFYLGFLPSYWIKLRVMESTLITTSNNFFHSTYQIQLAFI